MDSVPIGCAGVGCSSGLVTWPLHHIRRSDGELCRLCSSCLLLEYRSLYCCCCFLLLGPEPPAHFDDGDPILAPPVPVATCRLCNEAVAHRYCLQSADDTFVCPACAAATQGWPFSYAPATGDPLDVRATRIMLLAGRISLSVLRKAAAAARATADRLFAEAEAEKARAFRALAVAFGVDTELPSTNRDVQPLLMLDEAPESSTTNMDMIITPSENQEAESNVSNIDISAPSENLPSEGSLVTMAMGLDLNAPPPPPSPAAHTIGVDDVTGMAMTAAEAARPSSPPPPRRTLKLFRDDKNPADEDGDM